MRLFLTALLSLPAFFVGAAVDSITDAREVSRDSENHVMSTGPGEVGMFRLSQMRGAASREGDNVAAERNFSAAEAGKRPAGKAANSSLAEMGLSAEPETELQVKIRVIGRTLVGEIINPTPKEFTDITVQIQIVFRNDQDKRFSAMVPVKGTVPPGGTGRVVFDLGARPGDAVEYVDGRVVSARTID